MSNSLTKKCSCCGNTKPLNDFYANPMGKMGRHSQCRSCQASKGKDRYYADLETNRKKKAERQLSVRAKRKQRGGVSPDYVKFAAQQPRQYDRVKSILERATERQVRRLCLQIIYSGQDKWRRLRTTWKGDELLAQHLGE